MTNPLQNNNTAVAIVSYIAGIVAAKFPIFDLATWNYIFMSIGGLVFLGAGLVLNRKSAIVSTAANLPEVSKIDLDKTVAGSDALNNTTPLNVVLK